MASNNTNPIARIFSTVWAESKRASQGVAARPVVKR